MQPFQFPSLPPEINAEINKYLCCMNCGVFINETNSYCDRCDRNKVLKRFLTDAFEYFKDDILDETKQPTYVHLDGNMPYKYRPIEKWTENYPWVRKRIGVRSFVWRINQADKKSFNEEGIFRIYHSRWTFFRAIKKITKIIGEDHLHGINMIFKSGTVEYHYPGFDEPLVVDVTDSNLEYPEPITAREYLQQYQY